MDRTELRLLLEDLLMMRAGHRNVTEEHLEGAWLAIGGGSGYSIDGLISEADFKGWLATHGLQVAGVPAQAHTRRAQSRKKGFGDGKTEFIVFRGAVGADYTSY